jgi:O-methyltransferase
VKAQSRISEGEREAPGLSTNIDPASTFEQRYLSLLKLCLLGLAVPHPHSAWHREDLSLGVAPLHPDNLEARLEGRDWPLEGYTMIGMKRLENVQACVEDVLANEVPGDLIEAGVWRGGAAMLMRALLRLHSVDDRAVFVADSFEGLPSPDPESFPFDSGSRIHEIDFLSVSLEDVKSNFQRFGLLDDQVRFVKGWFRDTLPSLSDATWSVIRLDGDMYESTMVSLEALYPNLSPGGYVIIDDFHFIRPCQRAVMHYREAHGIDEEMQQVDWNAAYWQKVP